MDTRPWQLTKRKYDTGDGERREERESAIIGKGIEQFSGSLQCLKTEKRATLIFFWDGVVHSYSFPK